MDTSHDIDEEAMVYFGCLESPARNMVRLLDPIHMDKLSLVFIGYAAGVYSAQEWKDTTAILDTIKRQYPALWGCGLAIAAEMGQTYVTIRQQQR